MKQDDDFYSDIDQLAKWGGIRSPSEYDPPAIFSTGLESEKRKTEGIRLLFERLCPDVKADKQLLRAVCALEADFVAKKTEHVEFFGGALIGVHQVRFTDDDRNKLVQDILMLDESELRREFEELPGTPINKEFKVSSDPFNVSCVWLIHLFISSKYLSKDEREEGAIRICQYLQYRFLTSLIFHYFRFPTTREVAEATYARLSNKFALKYHGSWYEALRSRAVAGVSSDGIHADVVEKMDDDHRVVNMLNDLQGRIRDMYKNIYEVFMQVVNSGSKFKETSSSIELDGDAILKDKKTGLQTYTTYIRLTVSNYSTFYRQELFDVVCDAMDTMPPRLLQMTLEWLSKNYVYSKDNYLIDAVDLVMEHAYLYFMSDKDFSKDKIDLLAIVLKLRGAYMSARSTDDNLQTLRFTCESIVRDATGSKNDSVVKACRTGLMLYIVLRAFTKNHYSK